MDDDRCHHDDVAPGRSKPVDPSFASSAGGSPNVDSAVAGVEAPGFSSRAGGSPNVDSSPVEPGFSSSASGSPNVETSPEPRERDEDEDGRSRPEPADLPFASTAGGDPNVDRVATVDDDDREPADAFSSSASGDPNVDTLPDPVVDDEPGSVLGGLVEHGDLLDGHAAELDLDD